MMRSLGVILIASQLLYVAIAGEVWSGSCVRVVDGDTLRVVRDGDEAACVVRVWGIDAVEKKQELGAEAQAYLEKYVLGKRVEVREKQKRDRYGRVVAQGRVGKRSVALTMLLGGYAWWYEKYAPNAEGLRKAQEKARKRRKGVWMRGDAVPPWIYRKKGKMKSAR